MEHVWPAPSGEPAQSRTRFRPEIKHASGPFPPRVLGKLSRDGRWYLRRVRITSVIVNTRVRLHDPGWRWWWCTRSLEGRQPFSKEQKFIPPPRDTFRSGCSPERFPFTLTRKRAPLLVPLRVLCVDAVAICDIALLAKSLSRRALFA